MFTPSTSVPNFKRDPAIQRIFRAGRSFVFPRDGFVVAKPQLGRFWSRDLADLEIQSFKPSTRQNSLMPSSVS
jgi:hypothetical protein